MVDIGWTLVTGSVAGISAAVVLLILFGVFALEFREAVFTERKLPKPPDSWRDTSPLDGEWFFDQHSDVEPPLDLRIYRAVREFFRKKFPGRP